MHQSTQSLNLALLGALRANSDATALHDGTVGTTYAELLSRVTSTAENLRELGVKKGNRVAYQLTNTREAVTLLLATLMVRAVPVPLLPAYREAELANMIRVVRPDVIALQPSTKRLDSVALLTRAEQKSQRVPHVLASDPVDGLEDRFLNLAEFCAPLKSAPDLLVKPLAPDDIVMMLMSSGSTGLPKAIARRNEGYRQMIADSCAVFQLDKSSVYLASMSVCHGFSLNCPGLLGALLAGATVVLDGADNISRSLRLIEELRVTHSTLVPALLAQWIEHQTRSPRSVETLWHVQVGGARLEPDLAKSAMAVLGIRVQQCYGMSEGLLCFNRIGDSEDVLRQSQGRPLSTQDQIRIVDEFGNLLPHHAIGELQTRGPYTITSYYRNPAADKKAFTEDGFYRTGDLAFTDEAGNVYIQGRLNDVINRAGEKFSPVEIEVEAARHPRIKQAACIGVPNPFFGETPCLFVVPHGEPPTLGQIRRHFGNSGLAPFKVPDHIEVVERIPMKGIGKIDRHTLRQIWADRHAELSDRMKEG